jgi:hypothetical protein
VFWRGISECSSKAIQPVAALAYVRLSRLLGAREAIGLYGRSPDTIKAGYYGYAMVVRFAGFCALLSFIEDRHWLLRYEDCCWREIGRQLSSR